MQAISNDWPFKGKLVKTPFFQIPYVTRKGWSSLLFIIHKHICESCNNFCSYIHSNQCQSFIPTHITVYSYITLQKVNFRFIDNNYYVAFSMKRTGVFSTVITLELEYNCRKKLTKLTKAKHIYMHRYTQIHVWTYTQIGKCIEIHIAK